MSQHTVKLLELIGKAKDSNTKLPSKISADVEKICENIESQKGVYTVLITLGVHKILFPEQDIRYFQENMEGGFSARTIDTKYITPTLKEQGLPSMAESGWLTRSLEQPYPYLESYNGKIQKVKKEFLRVVGFFEKKPAKVGVIVIRLLTEAINIRERNRVSIESIENPERLTIAHVLETLEELLGDSYSVAGGSKLPVIVLYSLYELLIFEFARYKDKRLGNLASHTASDSTSKSSGDIEIFDEDGLFESVEIKFGIEVSMHMLNRAVEKIALYNPKRYYILSTKGIAQDDYEQVIDKIFEVKEQHGCQIIINGVFPTVKYYLRLLDKVEIFLDILSKNILQDNELKIEHKQNWQRLFSLLNSP